MGNLLGFLLFLIEKETVEEAAEENHHLTRIERRQQLFVFRMW